MSLILSVETAATGCSVALHVKGELLASSHRLVERSASSQLGVMIDEVLKRCDRRPHQLDALAVSLGPGSYTGLRIGVATAKGMCYSLDIPFIAVNTLEVLVGKVKRKALQGKLLCPMMEAGGMNVFCLIADDQGNTLMPMRVMSVEPCSFDAWLARYEVLFFGSGSEKCKSIIESPRAKFMPHVPLSAVQVGEIAFKKFVQQQFADLLLVEPDYLVRPVYKKSN